VSGRLPVPAARLADDPPVSARPPVPILIVDDDEMKRFALKRLLAPLGYAIVEADSGRAALRCVLAEDFALILLDIRMPVMDGFETAALLRTRKRSELIPILLSTASTRDEIMASGLYGDSVKDFVLAPVEPDELRCLVEIFGNLYLKAQEVTAQVEEQKAGAENWRMLTEVGPVGIFRADHQRRYTYVSPRWSEITGIPAELALGQEWTISVDTAQAAGLHTESATEVPGSAQISDRTEIRVPGADRKIVLLTANRTPVDQGGRAGWMGTMADVTAVTWDPVDPLP
jgi:PAS domain S-box-containing protein